MKDYHKVESFLIPVCTTLFLGQEVSEKISASMTAKEWDALCSYSSAHGVLPLLMSYVHRLEIKDKEIVSCILSWYVSAQQQANMAMLMEEKAEKLAGIFQNHHLDALLNTILPLSASGKNFSGMIAIWHEA